MRWFLSAICLSAAIASPAAAQAVDDEFHVLPDPEFYPPEALAAKLEGDVRITLTIAPDGTLRCEAPDKAASAVLRRTSCQIIVQHWIFAANQKKGVPQATEVKFLVSWKVRDAAAKANFGGAIALSPGRWITNGDFPAAALRKREGGDVQLGFDVTDRGTMENCAVVKADSEALIGRLCAVVSKHAMLLPAIGPDGQPRPTKGFLTVRLNKP